MLAMPRFALTAGLVLLALGLLCRLAPLEPASAVVDVLAIGCSLTLILIGLASMIVSSRSVSRDMRDELADAATGGELR